LSAAHVEVEQRDAVHDRPGHLADVVAGGRLDLDHFGAEIGEVGGDGAGTEERALDHAETSEGRTRCVAHGRGSVSNRDAARNSRPSISSSRRPRDTVAAAWTGRRLGSSRSSQAFARRFSWFYRPRFAGATRTPTS